MEEKDKPTFGLVRNPNGDAWYTDKRRQIRHYVAVLIQANRYRRDQNVPSIYRMPDPKELGKAIDFAVNIIKTHLYTTIAISSYERELITHPND